MMLGFAFGLCVGLLYALVQTRKVLPRHRSAKFGMRLGGIPGDSRILDVFICGMLGIGGEIAGALLAGVFLQ